MKSHTAPELPWTRVSADIFEWNNMKYLVTVDAYSGWFEIDTLHDLTSKTVIKKMKRHFAAHGVPELLMTDNGSQFVSKEFQMFAKEWSFKQVTSSPNYPQSNGLAENAVKQAKQLLEKSKRDGSDPMLGLLNLRNTPRDNNLGSPAQRLMSRRTRTAISTSKKLFVPKVIPCKRVSQRIREKRRQQKLYYDKNAKMLGILKENQVVRIQTARGYDKLGVVKKTTKEPRSYMVETDGKEYRRNRRHLLAVPERNHIVKEEPDEFISFEDSYNPRSTEHTSNSRIHDENDQTQKTTASPEEDSTVNHPHPLGSEMQKKTCGIRRHQIVTRSGRISKPNSKYKDYVS